jgi:DNA (cytosine-5)-methyltransferase 1
LSEDLQATAGSKRLSAIDLFAGGGGLSVGLKDAGFTVVAAVELDRSAIATYSANHTGVTAFPCDIRELHGVDLLKANDDQPIDLIAGCPPCQGFTSLTAKWGRDDPRDDLIVEMGRLVAEILPKAVMMENVPGLARKGKKHLREFIEKLEALGYIVQHDILQVADYGTPQLRRRLVLMAGLGFKIDLPAATHSRAAKEGLERWATVRSAIDALPEPSCFPDVRKTKATDLDGWHVVRKMSDANKERLKWTTPGSDWRSIPEHLRPACHQGEYFGFRNVYGRMKWEEPSPTITAGCTTFSKGRFGHPEEDRTISVKEAALLQQFPADYKFETRQIDQACSVIGNALPCGFATRMAQQVMASLDAYAPQRPS